MNILLFFSYFQHIPVCNILLLIKYFKTYRVFASTQGTEHCSNAEISPWIFAVFLFIIVLVNLALHTLIDVKRNGNYNSLRNFFKHAIQYALSLSILLEIINANFPIHTLLYINPFHLVFSSISFSLITCQMICLYKSSPSHLAIQIFNIFHYALFLYALIYLMSSNVTTFFNLNHIIQQDVSHSSFNVKLNWWTENFFVWVFFTMDLCASPPRWISLKSIASKKIENVQQFSDYFFFFHPFNFFVAICTALIMAYFIFWIDSLHCLSKFSTNIPFLVKHLMQFQAPIDSNLNIFFNVLFALYLFSCHSSLFALPFHHFIQQFSTQKTNSKISNGKQLLTYQAINNTLYVLIFTTILGIHAYAFPYVQQLLILSHFILNWIAHFSSISNYYLYPYLLNYS